MEEVQEVEKKRGRPLKKKNIIEHKVINEDLENQEILLKLAINKNDIDNHKTVHLTLENINEEISKLMSETSIDNKKQYLNLIKQLVEKNENLEKYISTISPMFNTEIKFYPIGIVVEDEKNKLIELKQTNICCLNCSHPFDWLPSFLPISYQNGKFVKMGNSESILFCSFNCACSYNLSLNDTEIDERYRLLKLLYYKIYADKIKSVVDITIPQALPKELLKMFGGPLTIEEYRFKSKIIEKEYHKLLPPFIPSGYTIEEVTKNDKNIIFNYSINNYPSSSKNLKRTKQVQNVQSKLIDDL